MPLPVISCRQMCLRYQDNVVFDQLTLSLSQRGVSFIVGENGAGKTQLLRCIHGLTVPESGEVQAPAVTAQAFVPQQPVLLSRSVEKNLTFIDKTAVTPRCGFVEKLTRLMDDFRLQSLRHTHVAQLSGGQRKRVAIVRALLQDADYYLFDEATANLDRQSALVLEQSIGLLTANQKKIVLATHDWLHIERLFVEGRDELLVLQDGKILQQLPYFDLNIFR